MSQLPSSVTVSDVVSPLVFGGVTDGALSIEGDAIVEGGAIFRGQLSARRVVILGTFDGTVTARESLRVGPSAVLIGEARTARLTLDPGAGVEAHVRAGSIEARAAVLPVETSEAAPTALAAVYAEPVPQAPAQQALRTTIHAATTSTAIGSAPAGSTPPGRRPEAKSAAADVAARLQMSQAVSLDEVERTLAGFEVKLAQMAARAK